MKWLPLIACLWAAPLHAQSLCDVTDPDRLAAVLQGVWTQEGGLSIETETLSVTQALAHKTASTSPQPLICAGRSPINGCARLSP